MTHYKYTLTVLLGLILALTSIQFVSAAPDTVVESITLSPTSKRYSLKAGETKTDDFTVINDGKIAYDLDVYAQPYFVRGQDYAPDYSAKRANSDAHTWVEFSKKRYHLKPGESLVVPYTVTVPVGAAPGGHYGVLFAETQSVDSVKTSNSVVRKKRVGSVIYATVTTGSYKNEGTVVTQGTSFFQFTPPIASKLTIKNTGNTDFVSTTLVEISGIIGGSKHTEKKDYVVLPGTTRALPFSWQEAPSFGLFKVTIATSFLQTNHNTTHYVLMMPLWMYLALAVAILALVMYGTQLRR